MFLIQNFDILKKVRILKGEWLGIYQGIHLGLSQGRPTQELLCASRSLDVLYRKLKKMGVIFPILARRAQSKKILPREIKPAEPDHFTKSCRSAYEAVAYARQLLDPDGFSLFSVRLRSYEWFVYELMNFDHSLEKPEAKSLSENFSELRDMLLKLEARASNWNVMQPQEFVDLSTEFVTALRSAKEKNKFRVTGAKAQRSIDKFLADSEAAVIKRFDNMRRALDFLRTLANRARSKGEKSGDRATGSEIRKVIALLHRLAQGEPLKAIAQVVIEGQVQDDKSLKRYRSLNVLVSRFSKRVARAVREQYGPRIASLDYNHLFHAVRDWNWLDRRTDRMALMEAARRGLPHVRIV
jgi:hypothetical protein